MAETTHIDAEPLNYGVPLPPGNADPRRMFMYLLPVAICVGAIIGSWMIEYTFPNGDSRNFSGPMCVFVTAPLGLIFGIMAIREAFRPRGLRALFWGAGWNVVTALGPWAALWMIVRFGLLKRL
jgi:hypothetical protein